MSILFLIIFHYLRQVLWPFEYCSSDTKKSNESWLFVHTADNAQVTNTTIVLKPNTMKKLTYLVLTVLRVILLVALTYIVVACSSEEGNDSNACNGDNPVFF